MKTKILVKRESDSGVLRVSYQEIEFGTTGEIKTYLSNGLELADSLRYRISEQVRNLKKDTRLWITIETKD